MKRSLICTVAALVAALVIYSGGNAEERKTGHAGPTNGSTPPVSEGTGPITGKIVETMNSGGYTYILLENKGKKTWFAVPGMQATKGKTISLRPGAEMTNFKSTTLNRTFDHIIFSDGVPEAQKASQGHGSDGGKVGAAKSTEITKVKKADGPNAYTVAEAYKNIARLNNKNIAVRGKVVKVSEKIMGKNWIHLQDGTGDAGNGTNDLILTSAGLPAVGDVITAAGTLLKDKDFGSGYKYAVIIENAKISK